MGCNRRGCEIEIEIEEKGGGGGGFVDMLSSREVSWRAMGGCVAGPLGDSGGGRRGRKGFVGDVLW